MDPRTTVPALLLLLLGLCNAYHDNDLSADDELSAVQSEREDISSAILRMNKGSSDILHEGDLLIPKTRTAIKCLNKAYSCLWPKSANGNVKIAYIISDKYDDSERDAIIRAMEDFKTKTCIQFVPRKSEREYLNIVPRNGCFSMLGRIGDRQMLSLQRGGCIHHGIIQHELMHAMGFNHEHTRSDRDQYVKINWENVKSYYKSNFQKKDTDHLNIPYDYNSILHYGRTAFGKARAETITPIPDPTVPIGQRNSMSEADILRINTLYKCYKRNNDGHSNKSDIIY